MDHNKLGEILKEMGIPDHLTCPLRNLYASKKATVRTGHRTTDWFQIGKEVHQGCIYCHPTYLTSMQSTSCKMPGWMKHKLEEESEKGGLKLSIQKTNIMAPGLISSVQFSRSVVSDFLQPHESQHTRPPCPSPTPRVHSDSRPSSPWCHPAISSSVVPFSLNPSQHQSLFQWVNSSHEVAKVLEFQL